MPPSVLAPLRTTLFGGFVGQGPRVDEFEHLLSEWLGVPYVLTTNSGTSALQLAYLLSGVKPGTSVVTTPVTCTATNMPILAQGGRIIWADVNPRSGSIDPENVERKIEPDTVAITCVHWAGNPCDLQELRRIADEHGLRLIEDSAHALGAVYQEKKIGQDSDLCAFSFQAIKHLSTIDGGALICKSEADYKRGKLLRWYGMDREDKERLSMRCEADVKEAGHKWHMNDIAATIGIEQMRHIDKIIERHWGNALYYDYEFCHRGIRRIAPVPLLAESKSAAWVYSVLAEYDRDGFATFMKVADIQVSRVHERNDIHTCFASSKVPLPGVDEFTRRQISIPCGWWITDDDRAYIMDKITEWDRR